MKPGKHARLDEERLGWALGLSCPYLLILVGLKLREYLFLSILPIDTWEGGTVGFWILLEFVLLTLFLYGVAGLQSSHRLVVGIPVCLGLNFFAFASHEILQRLSTPINLFILEKAVGFILFLGGYFAEAFWVFYFLGAMAVIVLLTLGIEFLIRLLFRVISPPAILTVGCVLCIGLLPLVVLGPTRPSAMTYLPSSLLSVAGELTRKRGIDVFSGSSQDNSVLDSLRHHVELTPELSALKGKAAGMNVIIYLLETMPSFFVDPQGPHPHLIPNFSHLASSSLRFGNHRNMSMLSNPSLFTILTASHTSRNHYVKYDFIFVEKHPVELFRKANYRTGIFSSAQFRYDFLGYALRDILGFDKVFDADQLLSSEYRGRGIWFDGNAVFDDRVVIDEAAAWIRVSNQHEKPFLALLWPQNSHNPYWSPPDRHRRLADSDVFDRFLNSLAYQDYLLGRFLEELERLGQLESTILLVTADHGLKHIFPETPEIAEDGTILPLRETDTHMPLYLYHPRLFDGVPAVRELTSHLDIFPTLLDLLGIEFDPTWFDGRSVLGSERNRVVPTSWGFDSRYLSFTDDYYKYKYDYLTGTGELFRLESPGARLLESGEQADRRRAFQALAQQWRAWEVVQARRVSRVGAED